MPKLFSEREKEVIRQTLIDKGREFFGTYGLKRTSVADLTKAAGIAQGTFYKFFNSKEELCFEILEREHSIRDQFITQILTSTLSTGDSLKQLLKETLNLVENSPIVKKIYDERGYDLLLRKLPPEKLARHYEADTKAVLTFISELQKKGELIKVKPEVIGGIFRAFFLLTLHKEEIGNDIYPEVMGLLSDLVATGLVKREKQE